MSQYELLNNLKHRDLKILTQRSVDMGDGVGGCVVYPTELNELQKFYPVFLQKQDDGAWLLVSVFGFENNENLYLQNGQWCVPYIPAVIEREPFLIGMQSSPEQSAPVPVIHVDMQSPRISRDGAGEAVFLQQGGNSLYLERMMKVLSVVHEGVAEAERMFAEFSALDLFEPINLEVELDNASHYVIDKFYTVSKDRLLSLPDNQIGRLHRNGLLRYAYMIIGSLTNFQRLVDYKNQQVMKGL